MRTRRTYRAWRIGAIAMCLMLLSVGCASLKEQSDQHGGTMALVTNRNWLSMEIYVVDESRRVRLGRVQSGKQKEFRIPPYLLSSGTSLRFEMESSGPTPTVLTESIVLKPGEDIVLVIPNTR